MPLIDWYDQITARLRTSGDFIWPFLLRAIMWWEFWESGSTKLKGENYFDSIPWAGWQVGFPFPFNTIPSDLNWVLATWGEIIFCFMILFGLFTRFAAFSLIVVTVVAMIAVHWPAEWNGISDLWQSYAITAKNGHGNFKLALLFIIMLMPLVFHGGGKLSLDFVLKYFTGRGSDERKIGDLAAIGVGLLVLGTPLIYMFPLLGGAIIIAGIGAIVAHRFV